MGDDGAEGYEVTYAGEETVAENAWISKATDTDTEGVTIKYPNGNVFQGQYDDEKLKQGKGKYTWSKADEEEDEGEPKEPHYYDGEYKNGKRTGLGEMTFPNGDRYHGMWQDGKKHGEGTYTYKNKDGSDDIYSGTWVSDVKEGKGYYEFGADGSMMIGTWEKGSIVEGEWRFKDGGSYTGIFKNGKPTGNGTFNLANGYTQSGAYISEEVVKEEGEEPEVVLSWQGAEISQQ